MRTVSVSPARRHTANPVRQKDRQTDRQIDGQIDMSGFKRMIAKKVGDFVEDQLEEFLGIGDNEKEEGGGGGGGFLSDIFNKDDEKKERDRKKKEEGGGGFLSDISDMFNKDDKKEKKSGFDGLFSELEGGIPAGMSEGGAAGGGGGGGGGGGQSVAVNDGDLFEDLMEVAEETSGGS